MFNIGGGEILLICVLALVVVGPEQLPSLLRKLGQYAGQAKQMSESLRSEFMAGTEPFQESIKEFQKGMNDFSSTVTQNADVRTWGTGTADDPIVPRGFADQDAGGPEDSEGRGSEEAPDGSVETSEGSAGNAAVPAPITRPVRVKKLEITPPVNPWAPLPGSGADTAENAVAEATVGAQAEPENADALPENAVAAPGNVAVPGNADAVSAGDGSGGIDEQTERAAQQLANRGRERTVIPPIAPFSSFPPRDTAPVADEVPGENA